MRDYLFVNPFLHPPGGGEGVANFMIQTLAQRGSVTVLCWVPPNYREIDDHYGTHLSELEFETIVAAPRVHSVLNTLNIPHRLLQVHWIARCAKRLRPFYRQCLSAFNELDLGPPAVQYIHHPTGVDLEQQVTNSNHALVRFLWPFYQLSVKHWSNWSNLNVKNNYTLVNSQWTGRSYLENAPDRQVHRVLYPPPSGGARVETSGPKEEAFLSIGRLVRCKNWPQLVQIVDRLRSLGFEIGLTLAGGRSDPTLLQEVLSLVSERSSWLRLELDIPRDRIDHLIAQHRYGIHAMHQEHYGMAIAELVLGGCLTFVHDSGGQVEIVEQEAARYCDVDDAVAKIARVLQDPQHAARLLQAQQKNRERLSRERFHADFVSFLDDLESGNLEGSGPRRFFLREDKYSSRFPN